MDLDVAKGVRGDVDAFPFVGVPLGLAPKDVGEVATLGDDDELLEGAGSLAPFIGGRGVGSSGEDDKRAEEVEGEVVEGGGVLGV